MGSRLHLSQSERLLCDVFSIGILWVFVCLQAPTASTGLGLPLSRAFSNLCGGWLCLEDDSDGVTHFWGVLLARAPDEAELMSLQGIDWDIVQCGPNLLFSLVLESLALCARVTSVASPALPALHVRVRVSPFRACYDQCGYVSSLTCMRMRARKGLACRGRFF